MSAPDGKPTAIEITWMGGEEFEVIQETSLPEILSDLRAKYGAPLSRMPHRLTPEPARRECPGPESKPVYTFQITQASVASGLLDFNAKAKELRESLQRAADSAEAIRRHVLAARFRGAAFRCGKIRMGANWRRGRWIIRRLS